MRNTYFQQQNFIPQESDIQWNTIGYSAMGLDVTGAFSAGSFTLEGTNDGATWTPCKISDGSTTVETGIISATGHYTVLTIGFNVVKLTPSGSLDATLALTALGTTQVPNMES